MLQCRCLLLSSRDSLHGNGSSSQIPFTLLSLFVKLRFWARTEPQGSCQAVLGSALNLVWGNHASAVSRIEVPAGTRIFEGAVASQIINGGAGALYGGGNQIMFEPGFRVPEGWLR